MMMMKSNKTLGCQIKRRQDEGEVRRREKRKGKGKRGSVRNLGVRFQLLAQLFAISAVLGHWPAAPALTPS